MSAFYIPITIEIKETPVIVYPMIGLEKVIDRRSNSPIENHLENLLSAHLALLSGAQYCIIILWEDSGKVMTDVWLFGEFESWVAGPTVDVRNFKGLEKVTDMGVSAEDGLIMLGREGGKRRMAKTIKEFIDGSRPDLPSDIAPSEEFYLVVKSGE